MMVKITCIKCGTEGSMSLADPAYKGPYRCWKCRELFAIEIVDNILEDSGPFDQAESDREQEIQALRDKFKKK